MGKSLHDKMADLYITKDERAIIDKLFEIELMVDDMTKHLAKTTEECKQIMKDFDDGLNINLEKVVKEEIYGFYVDLKAWLKQVRLNLLEVVDFYADLKKKYKGEVLLLRDDWVSFIKDWLANSFISVSRDLKPLNSGYQEFKEKSENFLQETQKNVMTTQNHFKEIVEMVQVINDTFLLEKFFVCLEEGKEVTDKVSLEITKVVNRIKVENFEWWELREKYRSIIETAEQIDRSIKFLNQNKMLNVLFSGGIKSWDVLQDYYKSRSIGIWLDLLEFAELELALDPSDELKKSQFRDKVQTLEGLYLYAEQELKCQLNPKQKEFLGGMYEWIKKIL